MQTDPASANTDVAMEVAAKDLLKILNVMLDI